MEKHEKNWAHAHTHTHTHTHTRMLKGPEAAAAAVSAPALDAVSVPGEEQGAVALTVGTERDGHRGHWTCKRGVQGFAVF